MHFCMPLTFNPYIHFPKKINIKTSSLKNLPNGLQNMNMNFNTSLTHTAILKIYALTGREFNLLHAGSIRTPAKHRPPDVDTSSPQACYRNITILFPVNLTFSLPPHPLHKSLQTSPLSLFLNVPIQSRYCKRASPPIDAASKPQTRHSSCGRKCLPTPKSQVR